MLPISKQRCSSSEMRAKRARSTYKYLNSLASWWTTCKSTKKSLNRSNKPKRKQNNASKLSWVQPAHRRSPTQSSSCRRFLASKTNCVSQVKYWTPCKWQSLQVEPLQTVTKSFQNRHLPLNLQSKLKRNSLRLKPLKLSLMLKWQICGSYPPIWCQIRSRRIPTAAIRIKIRNCLSHRPISSHQGEHRLLISTIGEHLLLSSHKLISSHQARLLTMSHSLLNWAQSTTPTPNQSPEQVPLQTPTTQTTSTSSNSIQTRMPTRTRIKTHQPTSSSNHQMSPPPSAGKLKTRMQQTVQQQLSLISTKQLLATVIISTTMTSTMHTVAKMATISTTTTPMSKSSQ